MRLILLTIEPIQQVAAEPGTLDELTALLRAHAAGHPDELVRHVPSSSLTDWPLVADPRLPSGFIYLRPTPCPAVHVDRPQQEGEQQ